MPISNQRRIKERSWRWGTWSPGFSFTLTSPAMKLDVSGAWPDESETRNSRVTNASQLCHNWVTVASQWRHSFTKVASHLHHSYTTDASQLCHNCVTDPSQSSHARVTVASQWRHSGVTVLMMKCLLPWLRGSRRWGFKNPTNSYHSMVSGF